MKTFSHFAGISVAHVLSISSPIYYFEGASNDGNAATTSRKIQIQMASIQPMKGPGKFCCMMGVGEFYKRSFPS